jgi:hypothetical protein
MMGAPRIKTNVESRVLRVRGGVIGRGSFRSIAEIWLEVIVMVRSEQIAREWIV